MILTEGKSFREVAIEIRDKLVEQGKQCKNGLSCQYGDGHGNHCAVGWLLPADSPAMVFEGDVCELLKDESDLGPNDEFIRDHVVELGEIQRIHDELYRGSEFYDIFEPWYKLIEA